MGCQGVARLRNSFPGRNGDFPAANSQKQYPSCAVKTRNYPTSGLPGKHNAIDVPTPNGFTECCI